MSTVTSLSQIKIELDGIGHTLSDRELMVPKYQRSYAWEEKHVSALYSDIATAIANREVEYFLGSIVVTHNMTGRPEVVDGQQRLATITILISAIRDYLYSNNDENTADDIERRYLATR